MTLASTPVRHHGAVTSSALGAEREHAYVETQKIEEDMKNTLKIITDTLSKIIHGIIVAAMLHFVSDKQPANLNRVVSSRMCRSTDQLTNCSFCSRISPAGTQGTPRTAGFLLSTA